MKKTKLFRPYKNGKPTFKIRNKSGAYLIYKDGKVVYVGYSSVDVYKTMYRHFQQWNATQNVVSFYGEFLENFRCKIIFCTPKQAVALEYYFINKYMPDLNIHVPNIYKDRSYKEKTVKTLFNIYAEDVKDMYKGSQNNIEDDVPF